MREELEPSVLDREFARLERKYGVENSESVTIEEGQEILDFYSEVEKTYSEGVAATTLETLMKSIQEYRSRSYSLEKAKRTGRRGMNHIRFYEKLRLGGFPWERNSELDEEERSLEAEKSWKNYKQDDSIAF